jgi:hypothetical protein
MTTNPPSDRSSWWSQAFRLLFFLGLVAFLLFSCEWLIGLFGHVFGAVIYGLGSIALIASFLVVTVALRIYGELAATSLKRVDFRSAFLYDFVLLLPYVPLYALLFGEFSCQLNYLIGGFDAPGAGFWDWAWYGLSWVVDSISFNTSRIFGWNLSDIHANAFWSQLLVLAFNVTLALVVIAAIVQFYGLIRAYSAQSAADKES